MRLVYAPAAREDLRQIALYIARDNPARAHSFVDELERVCARVARDPQLFRLRPEAGPGVRAAVHGRHLIFYREAGGAVRVERVLHGARDYGGLL
jgi:toxin ParE1/3/4